MTYFVQPKCELSPTATLICKFLSVDCVAWARKGQEMFNMILFIKWKALNRQQINSQNIESSDLYVFYDWLNSIITYYNPAWNDSSVFYSTLSDI